MSKWYALLAPLLGWFVAQAIKYAVTLRKDGLQVRDLYSSGGFPSSHTASTVALATYIGATEGWSSNIFAVAAVLAAVVMYDAIGVRRSVGEHTHVLKEMTKNDKKAPRLHVYMGHNPYEVLGGLGVGALVGFFLAAL